MVPLVMSSSREETPYGAAEEFATHLSLYDDSFHFIDRSVPTLADIKGPLPPSVFCPNSKNTVEVTGQVKVKRKCGRPRNPIPRHKRESHINAEHRRRGKIQDGFRTLKNIVPKYEQTAGRDSKADILFKAVDYSKLLQNDIKELSSSIEALRLERDMLSVDIKNYKTIVPDMCPYGDLPASMDDCYEEYVQHRSKESWTFSTFKTIMRPLFESYKLSVRGESLEEFMCSVVDWEASCLSHSNLRAVCVAALRDNSKEGHGVTSPYKGELPIDINNFRSATSVAQSLTSDANNNHCLGNQAFTAEHFSCRDGAESAGSSCGGGTTTTDVYGNTFDNPHVVPSSISPVTKGGHHVNVQPGPDLVPFSAGNSNNTTSIFSDLYYNLDHNLHHHHHINLARSSIEGSDPWSHLYFRQQHWHHHYHNGIPSSSYFHNFNKVHPLWGGQHPPPHQQLAGDFASSPNHFYDRVHPLTERDFRCDLPAPREPLEMLSGRMLSGQVPYLGHTTNFLDHNHGRHKRPSQSSSEGEGSLLNMDTFARQATENLGENDKYSQLSPSTDSGISPGGSTFVPSPGYLSGRSADYTFSYNNSSSLEHLKHHKSFLHERMDNLDSHTSMTLPPTYRDTFGRTAEQQRQPANRFDGVRARSCVSYNNALRASSRQASTERLEASTLLAKFLVQNGQQTQSGQTQMSGQCVDHMTGSLLHTNMLKSSGLPIPLKQESSYRSSSLSSNPGIENTCPNNMDLPPDSPKEKQQNLNLNFQTNQSQTNCSIGQNVLGVNDSSVSTSGWLQRSPRLHDSSGLDINRAVKLDEGDEIQAQICYFEMAHQQLLKHQSLSPNKSQTCETKSANLKRSAQQGSPLSPSHEADSLIYKTDPASYTQNLSSPLIKQSGVFHQHPIRQTSQSSMDTLSKLKARRKSSFECSYPSDEFTQADNGFKRLCNWQQSDQLGPDLPAKFRSSSEVPRNSVEKLSTFGDIAVHF